jgi:CheY-like chemotaxis protein
MIGEDEFDPTALCALVVDQNQYQRSITVDQLRVMGMGRVLTAGDSAEAWELLCRHKPDIVLVEWFETQGDGLDFVRRVRTSDQTPNRAVPMFMLTARGAQTDVEAARLAGVDGYLRKPISTLGVQKRLRTVVLNPQPFIVTANYVGPCRRRKTDSTYKGPFRRLGDPVEAANFEEEEAKAFLARACVATLEACARDLSPGDVASARKVFKAAQDLCDVAEQIHDKNLIFATREMMRYLQAQGATDKLDPEVVRTHVSALHQLAHIPHAMGDERERVAHSLKRMVDKKLRPANSA